MWTVKIRSIYFRLLTVWRWPWMVSRLLLPGDVSGLPAWRNRRRYQLDAGRRRAPGDYRGEVTAKLADAREHRERPSHSAYDAQAST